MSLLPNSPQLLSSLQILNSAASNTATNQGTLKKKKNKICLLLSSLKGTCRVISLCLYQSMCGLER